MEKRRCKIFLKALSEVKAQFPETKEFIEERLEQKCLKENMSKEEVIFLFTSLEAKSLHRKTFFLLQKRFD